MCCRLGPTGVEAGGGGVEHIAGCGAREPRAFRERLEFCC